MNILIDPLPYSVEIDGKNYKIDTDYTTSIRFELLMGDSNISNQQKIQLAVNLYFPIIPHNISEAIKRIIWFFAGGQEENTSKKTVGSIKRIYDYEYDAAYIYAAFQSDYGIDLKNGLHWWRFLAMFQALKEDNQFCKIMGYRSINLNKLKGEERKFYHNMQKRFALPAPKSEQDKLNKINEALLNGGDLQKVFS